jgi:hypothetical protein
MPRVSPEQGPIRRHTLTSPEPAIGAEAFVETGASILDKVVGFAVSLKGSPLDDCVERGATLGSLKTG